MRLLAATCKRFINFLGFSRRNKLASSSWFPSFSSCSPNIPRWLITLANSHKEVYIASIMHKLVCSQGGEVLGRDGGWKKTKFNIPCNFFIEVSKSREPFSMSLWKENVNKTDRNVINRQKKLKEKISKTNLSISELLNRLIMRKVRLCIIQTIITA